jgi:hypothetical protein
MARLHDLTNIPGMTKEMRDSVKATFDALSNWRDEIEAANERCLGKVLDHTSAVARSMGWPDQAIKATREYLENTSKVQIEMIDRITDGWKEQLQSTTAPMPVPRGSPGHNPAFAGAMAEFNPLTPWTFWLQAAEMWQRVWMPEAQPRRQSRSH